MHVVSDGYARPVEDITVMLVDDELIILNGLTSMLRRQFPHIQLQAFTNGNDALLQIGGHAPDLLITDLYMPQIDGIELIEKARGMGCENISVLTGFQEFELAQKAVKLHALDYMLKPVDKMELYALVETVARKLQKPSAGGDADGMPELLSLLLKPDADARTLAEALARYADASGYDLAVWQAVAKAKYLSALPLKAKQAALRELLPDLHRRTRIRSAVVLRSLDFIRDNLSHSIQLSDAARAVYVQANYFSTLFHRETGMSFVQYVNHARISLACEKLLGNPDMYNDQLAHECGFDNAGYFFRMFKRYTGVSPGEFRKMLDMRA